MALVSSIQNDWGNAVASTVTWQQIGDDNTLYTWYTPCAVVPWATFTSTVDADLVIVVCCDAVSGYPSGIGNHKSYITISGTTNTAPAAFEQVISNLRNDYNPDWRNVGRSTNGVMGVSCDTGGDEDLVVGPTMIASYAEGVSYGDYVYAVKMADRPYDVTYAYNTEVAKAPWMAEDSDFVTTEGSLWYGSSYLNTATETEIIASLTFVDLADADPDVSGTISLKEQRVVSKQCGVIKSDLPGDGASGASILEIEFLLSDGMSRDHTIVEYEPSGSLLVYSAVQGDYKLQVDNGGGWVTNSTNTGYAGILASLPPVSGDMVRLVSDDEKHVYDLCEYQGAELEQGAVSHDVANALATTEAVASSGQNVVLCVAPQYSGTQAVSDLVALYSTALGHGVTVAVVDAVDHAARRQQVIDALGVNSPGNLVAAVLIGTANDWEILHGSLNSQYYGDWPAGNWEYLTQFPCDPSFNEVPTLFEHVPYQSSGQFPRAYLASDLWYGDLDNDGVIDIPVSRWPVSTYGELEYAVERCVYYHTQGIPGIRAMLQCVPECGSTLEQAISKMWHDRIVESMDGIEYRQFVTGVGYSESQHGHIYPHQEMMRQYVPNIITGTASCSAQSGVLGLYQPSSYFKYGSQYPALLSATCQTADMAYTKAWPQSAHPYSKMLNTSLGSSPILLMGPCDLTMSHVAYSLTVEFYNELAVGVPIASSFIAAINECMPRWSGSDDVSVQSRLSAWSYSMYGDPLACPSLSPEGIVGVNQQGMDIGATKLSVTPNPVSSTVVLATSDKSSMLSAVIYDARGREVRRVDRMEKEAIGGGVEISVKALPSGVYFVKATTSSGSSVSRFTIVR